MTYNSAMPERLSTLSKQHVTNVRELTVDLVIGLFISVTLYSALSPRFLPLEKELISMIALAPLLSIFATGRLKGRNYFLAIWIILLTSFSLGLIVQEEVSGVRTLSSIVTLSGLLLIPFLFSSTTNLFSLRRFKLVVAVSMVAALLAPLFPDLHDFGRFDPPNNLIIGLSITLLLLVSTASPHFTLRALFFVAVLILTFESQWRFFFVAMLLLSTMCAVLRSPMVSIQIGGVALLFTGLFLWPMAQAANLESLIYQVSPRYASILNLRGLQGELGVRFTEVLDVMAHIKAHGSLLTTVFGFGHGAEFYANITLQSFGNLGAGGDWKWRFGEYGNTYTVHFGPARIYFRYGLLGLTMASFIIWIVIRETVCAVRGRSIQSWPEIIHMTVCLCSLLYIMQFFLQPIEHFPLFWLGLATLLCSPLRKGRRLYGLGAAIIH